MGSKKMSISERISCQPALKVHRGRDKWCLLFEQNSENGWQTVEIRMLLQCMGEFSRVGGLALDWGFRKN